MSETAKDIRLGAHPAHVLDSYTDIAKTVLERKVAEDTECQSLLDQLKTLKERKLTNTMVEHLTDRLQLPNKDAGFEYVDLRKDEQKLNNQLIDRLHKILNEVIEEVYPSPTYRLKS